MKGEINRDFYCLIGAFTKTYNTEHCKFHGCGVDTQGSCTKSHCGYYRRKWPTPEQYEEEYGEKYLEERPIWYFSTATLSWELDALWHQRLLFEELHLPTVCATTPWGKPPDDWRPE